VARAERIAHNEVVFRGLNENISTGLDHADGRTTVGFVCECGYADCHRIVELTAAEYEAIRADPTCFAVLSDHVIPDVEHVIADHGTWSVIRKDGVGREIADDLDPRAERRDG
jgi:hypothetical protein